MKYKKLRRECTKCGKMFVPIGKFHRVCLDCQPKCNNTFWHRMQRLSKENGKKDSKVRTIKNK